MGSRLHPSANKYLVSSYYVSWGSITEKGTCGGAEDQPAISPCEIILRFTIKNTVGFIILINIFLRFYLSVDFVSSVPVPQAYAAYGEAKYVDYMKR